MRNLAQKNPTAEQVLAKVRVMGPEECWPWMGRARRHHDGRGVCEWSGRTHSAPRVAWAIHAKIMPPSHLYVCHTCDNPGCCNPAHLYLGTASDNARDAVVRGRHKWVKRTACPQGHPYTPENTYRHTSRDGTTRRHCRTCKKAWQDTYRERRAA